jgi:hypothetical protein
VTGTDQRLAALERQVAQICDELAALRASVDAHVWRDRLAVVFDALAAPGTLPARNRAAVRRPRPRRLRLAGGADWARRDASAGTAAEVTS